MDFKLLFSGGKDIPADVRMIYGGLIKRHQKLKNGWGAVLLRNNMAYLYKNNAQPILVGGIKRIFEAADGKFMLVKENGEKAVFTADGIQTAAFSAGSELYWNGWYKIDDSEGVSLFKANGECLGSKLKAAGVFANGCYFMSVRYAEDGAKAGIYGADGKRLLFTNDTAVKMLKNGWFIAEDGLYDNLGNSYIGTVNGHTLDWWFLFAVGMFMPQRR